MQTFTRKIKSTRGVGSPKVTSVTGVWFQLCGIVRHELPWSNVKQMLSTWTLPRSTYQALQFTPSVTLNQ